MVEKAHLPIFADQYRQCMTRMIHARPPDIGVPVVLLTATAPPSLFSNIVKSIGCDPNNIEVVRGTCRRGNLALRLRHLNTGSSGLLTANVGACMKKALSSSLPVSIKSKRKHLVM